jgi:two-component system chemotaxis sensor kinase CheA
MFNTTSWTQWGKYREIVIAVALFVVLDLSILGLNFYTSFQIDQDTVAINLSGRQRYTSQRIARTLLELDAARASGLPYDPATLAELRNGTEIFQRSLMAFSEGGVVPGGDGKPVRLEAVTSLRGHELEAEIQALWAPYYALLMPIITNSAFTDDELAAALRYSQVNNLALLGVANEFVTETQAIGASRASRLRLIQTAGILLALVNFAFILFKFLRRLNENDRRIEAAHKETAEILGTVKEGLFLLDPELRVGSQISSSLSQILGRPVLPGSDFRLLLQYMVSPAMYVSACDYIGLLFGDRVRESLVTSLNPLAAIEVDVPSDAGTVKRFLTLQFNRVRMNDKVSHLLVTVLDVTRQLELEQALGDVKKRARSEIEVMLDLLKVHPASLKYFLDSAERKLLEVNDHLRNMGTGSSDYRRSVGAIFRLVHALKGEAAVLGLDMFEGLAQQFEAELAALRDKDSMSGEDLVALPLPLDEFLQRVTLARDLMTRLASYHDAFSDAGENAFVENLGSLARRIATDHGKEVQLITELDLFNTLPRKVQSGLKDIVVQLVRNAVVHGIEAPSERGERAKPSTGNIYVTLKPVGASEFEFVLRDDGRGLMPPVIRTALQQSGRYTEEQLGQFDDRQVVMKIFDAGFSTATDVGRDAGHGVGMDVVKQKIEQLGARLRITTRDHMFTQFSIRFAV